ncbi:SDR family oxidoreductase [Natrialbaceae archaeon GCM10025810]|uniref:SDR family oxidoreductase n=1 Tax=Halovalidus salilacus TaxID=3075124 RepID=UPI003614B76F
MSEPNEFDSDSNVVVVTGASAGVGRATARAFGERGAKVGLLARGEEGLEGAREDVEAAGGEAITIPTDVANADEVEDAAETVEAEFGPIDVWVNNAMVSVFSPAAEMTADDYRRVTEVTYLGYVHGTLAALDRMRPRDEGTIVQVGSALAYRGIPLQSAYCGSKHAIQGFTESVRTELIHDDCDVQLSMVQMPAMNTPQFEWSKTRLPRKPQPVPPIYQPEVAARAIAWTVDNGRDELWVGTPTLKAIVGNRLVPRRLDRRLARGGYDSQLTDEPVDPDREHNLHEPVSGDFGARGPYDERARDRSVELWVSTHRRTLAFAAVLVVGLAAALLDRLGSWLGSD